MGIRSFFTTLIWSQLLYKRKLHLFFYHLWRNTRMNALETFTTLDTLLAQEATKGPITSLTDLQERMQARKALETAFNDLDTLVTDRQRQFARLPRLPHYAEVMWAQAVLAFPNLAFLEVDTTGLGQDAHLVRVLLLDRDAHVFFDTCIKPPRPLSQKILHLTGLHQQDVQDAPTLVEVWPSLLGAFGGHYLLSYNLDFDLEHLQRAAEREHLEPPMFIAECLMQRWMVYRHVHVYPKLATLCQHIGSPLPDHPLQTAYHRACGQRALLQAMATGMVGESAQVSYAPESEIPENLEDDERPF
jgi:DNA polymerase III epsilon subunit-like protein